MKKVISGIIGILSAAVVFTSCSSDSDKDGGGGLGPTGTSSFAGTTVSFNPTLTFFAGGRVEYSNEEEGSIFDITPPGTVFDGTYNYEPSSDFRSGTMTVIIDGDETILKLNNFVTVDGFVQSFTILTGGVTYPATVDFGDLAAAVNTGSNGGTGGTDGGSDGGGDDFNFQANGNLEAGTNFTRTFLASNPQGDVSDSPLLDYSTGESVAFAVADDGSLEFEGVDGLLSLPFTASADGILKWDGAANGGTVSVVFEPSSSAQSDFTILWTGPFDVFNPGQIPIDNKVFN